MFSIFSLLRIFLFWRLSDALSDYVFSPPSVDNPVIESTFLLIKFDVLSITGRGRLSLLGGSSSVATSAVVWYSEYYKGHVVWSQQAILISPIASTCSDQQRCSFGSAVALEGNRILIGEFSSTEGGLPGAGAVYFFSPGDFTSWSLQQRIIATDPHTYAKLGSAVGLSGDYTIIGAPGDDDQAQGAGSAYAFRYVTVHLPDGQLRKETSKERDAFVIAGKKDQMTQGQVRSGLGQHAGVETKSTSLATSQFWSQQQKLFASIPLVAGQFGCKIKLKM